MQIITKRLIIRKAKIEDGIMILPFRNSKFVLQYNCMDVVNYEQCLKEIMNEHTWIMELIYSHKVIGVIDIHEDSIRYRIKSKEISYYLNEQYCKKEYMKEALTGILEYLFLVEQLECVSARAFTSNLASHKLLLSLGFHQDGVIPKCVKAYKDVVYDDGIYSILKEEYYAKNL